MSQPPLGPQGRPTGAQDWRTPPDLFADLHTEFGFTLDAAADAGNALLPRWLGPGSPLGECGLLGEWAGERIFLNPPFRGCGRWLAKAAGPSRAEIAVLVIPAAVGTRWWNDYVVSAADEVRIIAGRVRFVPPPGLAISDQMRDQGMPSPMAVVIYHQGEPPASIRTCWSWTWPSRDDRGWVRGLESA